MAVPSPRTWIPGEPMTAVLTNGHIRDPLEFLLDPPRCLLQATANQSIANETVTPLNFDVEDYDNYGGHDTVSNNDSYTIAEPGAYLLTMCAPWASNAAGKREGFFLINGTQNTGASIDALGALQHAVTAAAIFVLAAGDVVKAAVYQNSGGALNVDQARLGGQRFEVTWMNRGLA